MFDWKWSGLVRVFFRIFFRATWDRKWPAHRAEWTPRSAQFGTSSKRGFGWELWFPDLATQAVWCLPCFQTAACLMLLRSTPIAKWPGKRNSQRTSLQNWQNHAKPSYWLPFCVGSFHFEVHWVYTWGRDCPSLPPVWCTYTDLQVHPSDPIKRSPNISGGTAPCNQELRFETPWKLSNDRPQEKTCQ